MESGVALQMVGFCLVVANLFRRAFIGPQKVFAVTILRGLGLSLGLLAVALWLLNPWLYKMARLVWHASLLLWLLMLAVHFHYLMTRNRATQKPLSNDKENDMATTNPNRPDAAEDLTTPLRSLIRTDARAAARVNAIIDIVPCGLADLDAYRRQGVGLEALETFVKKHQRMPDSVEEIRGAQA